MKLPCFVYALTKFTSLRKIPYSPVQTIRIDHHPSSRIPLMHGGGDSGATLLQHNCKVTLYAGDFKHFGAIYLESKFAVERER